MATQPTIESEPQPNSPPLVIDPRQFLPNACGLLFAAGELLPNDTSVSHFVEAQAYSTPGSQATNAAGRVTTHRQDGTQEGPHPYETLTELVTKLGLTSEGTSVLLGRLRAALAH